MILRSIRSRTAELKGRAKSDGVMEWRRSSRRRTKDEKAADQGRKEADLCRE